MKFLWKFVTVTVWAWAAYLLCDYSGALELRFALLASFSAQGIVSFVLPRLARGRSSFLRAVLAPRWPSAMVDPAALADARAAIAEVRERRRHFATETNPSTGLTMSGKGGVDQSGHSYGC